MWMTVLSKKGGNFLILCWFSGEMLRGKGKGEPGWGSWAFELIPQNIPLQHSPWSLASRLQPPSHRQCTVCLSSAHPGLSSCLHSFSSTLPHSSLLPARAGCLHMFSLISVSLATLWCTASLYKRSKKRIQITKRWNREVKTMRGRYTFKQPPELRC